MDARIAEQAQVAMEAADLIVLVVDGTAGVTQDDLEVAVQLRRGDKPVQLVINKIDSAADSLLVHDFYGLGLGEGIAVSALHGTGSGDLLERLVAIIPEARSEPDGSWSSIAIVGRPNVGKSSILNTLLGETRSIVDGAPGTTRDPIDSFIEGSDGRVIRIIDTAGMRRQVQIQDPIEYFSFLRSRGTLKRVDAALLVIDAHEGVTGSDQRIANEILEAGRACVVALNKWDLLRGQEESDRARVERDLATKLRFLPWANFARTSAVSHRGVDKLLPLLETSVESHRTRLVTSLVNRLIKDTQSRRPHPRSGGRAIRILYAAQVSTAPPRFLLFTNGRLETTYIRYLENRFRDEYPFTGSPLKFEYRVRSRAQEEL
jgi:GTP-binding protein